MAAAFHAPRPATRGLTGLLGYGQPYHAEREILAPRMADFGETIGAAYATTGPAVELGGGVHDGQVVPAAQVKVPLKMTNRHGLIAGATGTGKTRTLQVVAEQLSAAGVSVFVTDVKGDLSGLAAPGAVDGPAAKRAAELGIEFEPAGFPVEYLSLGGLGPGMPVRATVSDFGPRLLAKILDANETQEQSLKHGLEELLQQLGIGEAAVTILSENGVPTPVVHTKLRPPVSRMGPADDVDAAAKASPLYAKYGTRVDTQSARELLAERLEQKPAAETAEAAPEPPPERKEAAIATGGGAGAIGDFLNSRTGKQLQREVVRGVFGLLKKKL